MAELAKVFQLSWKGFDLRRAIVVVLVLAVPLIFIGALDLQHYADSVMFGVLYVALSDPGGEYANRLRDMAAVGLIGTVLTALAFGIGTEAWGLVVLAAFVATLLGGLTVKFGLRRFVDGTQLNVWFVVAMFLPALYEAEGIKTGAWSQALAWMIGSAFFIAYTGIGWLARGRRSQPSRFPEIPGDTSPIPLTRPVIVYAVIRALALSIAVAAGGEVAGLLSPPLAPRGLDRRRPDPRARDGAPRRPVGTLPRAGVSLAIRRATRPIR